MHRNLGKIIRDPRRAQERRDFRIIREDPFAIANLPPEPLVVEWQEDTHDSRKDHEPLVMQMMENSIFNRESY